MTFQSAGAAEFEQPEPLQPSIASASDEPAEAMEAISIKKGWEIGLYAAEPDVANIVAFDIDNQGRIFVCESFRQSKGVTDNRAHDEKWLLADLAAETVQDRIDYHKRLLGEAAVTYAQHDDRLRLLKDTDGDHQADQSTVFASGFNRIEEGTGAGVLSRGEDVYYTNIPKLWKLNDTDGDGVADNRSVLSDGYGVKVAFRGHDLHGLLVGPDGRLYFTIGDRGYNITTDDGKVITNVDSGAMFRCELDGSDLQVVATGLRNPQEIAFNDYGDFFSIDNNSDSGDKARVVQLLEGGDSGWRMHYQYLPDRGPFNRQKIWEPFHEEQPAFIVPPITNFTDGPSGLAYYPGTGFGEQLRDTFLICDFRGGPSNSGIRSFRLEPKGAFYQFVDGKEQNTEQLAEQDTDQNIEQNIEQNSEQKTEQKTEPTPEQIAQQIEDADRASQVIWNVLATDVAFGPDGAIYFSDWVNGWDGLGKGRLYRVTDPDEIDQAIVGEVTQLLAGDWTETKTKPLSDLLSHDDRRVRLEAQWELARRGEHETLLVVASNPDASTLARLHGVWGSSQVLRTSEEELSRAKILSLLRPLLTGNDPIVVAAVAAAMGDHNDQESISALQTLIGSESDRVKYHSIMSLAKLKDAGAFAEVIALLDERDNSDPALRHAGAMYLAKTIPADVIAKLSEHPSVAVRRTAVVALRRIKSGKLADFLGDESPLVVEEAAGAIHDLPVRVAQKSLANLIDTPMKDSPVARRVINTLYRIGTSESATRLANFAGRPSAAVDFRLDALDALASWADPDPRDRVLNVYRPLKSRPVTDAVKAIEPQIDALMASQDEIRAKAIDVASTLGVRKIVPFLVARVAKQDSSSEARATALKGLAKLDAEAAVLIARKTKLLPTNEFVLASLSVLSELDQQNSIDKFIKATHSRDAQVQGLAWDILADHPSAKAEARIAEGVEAYIEGSLPSGVHLNLVEAANGRLSPELQKALSQHQTTVAEADSLGPWLLSLDGGDVQKGKKLFFEKTELSCVRCHRVDRIGGQVGPVLTVIGKQKDRRYLLESIAIPDANIAKGYETAVIANDSGEVFSGVVQSENDDEINLVRGDGSLVTIPTDEVVARKTGISSMPADLSKSMTARQLRDLVAYLASLQVDPSAAGSIE
nr:PVC-type heme-binding CxxCH protein [Rubripirellula obstinata]